MAVRRTNCYDQALACDIFDKFCNAGTLKEILSQYRHLCKVCKLCPTNFPEFYPKIKGKIPSWRAGEFWSKVEKRAAQKCYGRGKFCSSDTKVLIIGGGPCGIRTAIEAQLLGAKTVLVEKRDSFSRNNVLHLWPFTITDLRNLGAKCFYGKFCAGSIDHISIRQLQCILLKIALLIGVEVHENVSFEGLIEPEDENDLGWKASILPREHPVSHFHFDVVIGADGRRNTLPKFKRKALRAKLAIAITANFVHNHTEAEARVQEISGVSYIFKQEFFQELEEAMGIAMENIVYYKDETHYFVMTPTKQSLLEKGVLYQDFSDPEQLLSPENVDPEALQLFTMQAVVFATDNKLPDLQFARNYRGEPDLALFDFTTMYASETACRALERKGHKLLMGLVGDSLLEPFWPTGSGLGRGFLSAFDAAWMIRSWGKGLKSVCEVLAERESIYRVLGQTTHENLNKDYNIYSVDPTTRYKKINLEAVNPHQVQSLFDSDVNDNIFMSIRESKRARLVPKEVILKWFSDHVSGSGVKIGTIIDIFAGEEALPAIVNRFRPDLIDFPIIFEEEAVPGVTNGIVFELLKDEYDILDTVSGEDSIRFGQKDMPKMVEYLSQVYHSFKGEMPRNDDDLLQSEDFGQNEQNHVSYPNNSALHHSLSIKQFLLAKEALKEKKAIEEAQSKKERRRSQFYESIMQTQSNYNQQKSTSSVNIPVVKLNPVPPGELFSACRNGSDREAVDRSIVTDPIAKLAHLQLKRSRSDVGYRGNNITRSSSSTKVMPQHPLFAPSVVQSHLQSKSELEEMQRRIRNSKVTPLGDIVSTFLGKHIINQNSGCSSNGESDENPLSSERRHLRPARPRSMYQNVNDCPSNYEMEDQENLSRSSSGSGDENLSGYVEKRPSPTYSANPFQTPESDPGFKERCKFLEKNLYNSGRELKVHIGAAWFQKQESEKNNSSQAASSSRPFGNPLQKSQSSAATAGFHPLKRGSSFNVKNKMEASFNNTKTATTGMMVVGGQAVSGQQKEFNPKALFFGKKLGEMVDRHVPKEWRSEEKSPSPKPKASNDHNQNHHRSYFGNSHHHQQHHQNHHHFPQYHQQQSGSGILSHGGGGGPSKIRTDTGPESDLDIKKSQNNKGKSQKGKKFDGASSSATDSDLDCFLNAIDFTSIDGQDLQELLSSY